MRSTERTHGRTFGLTPGDGASDRLNSMALDTAGLRMLTASECMRLMSTVAIGRVALSHRALPMILPVHFTVDDQRIVIHTAAGTTLHQATDGAVVAFESEGPPGAVEPGWSVVVHGVARHVRGGPADDSGLRRIEITVDRVSGREVLDQ